MPRCTLLSKGNFLRGGVLAAVGVALVGAPPPAGAAVGLTLGTAASFAVLGASTVTNLGPSVVTGDLGVSPGTSITGFPPGLVSGGSIHAGNGTAAAAQADALAAFGVLGGMSGPPENDLTGIDLGGLTLGPGVYSFDDTAQLTGTLTLDAGCDAGAVFVFKVGSALTTASSSSVVVINGGWDYDENNVHWRMGSSATIGSDSVMVGNLIALASITLSNGTDVEGRALALTGAVSMDDNAVTAPPPPPPPGTLLLSMYWGHLTDAKATGLDLTHVRASYEYNGSPDGVLDPVADGMTIVFGPKGEAAPLTLVIPPAHPKWILKLGWWTWSMAVDGVTWTVKVDDVNREIQVHVSRFQFDPGDGLAGNWGPDNGDFPVRLAIESGNDSGFESVCFRNSLTFNHTRNWGVLRKP